MGYARFMKPSSKFLDSFRWHPGLSTMSDNEALQGMGRLKMKTEREKMLAGELYEALEPDLVRARDRARDLCQILNASREGDRELRRDLLLKIFGKGGDTAWLQPPFFCDYGSNIELGERVFFNFNCTVLDVCKVIIGDYSQFGSGVQILTPLHPLDAALRRKQEYGAPVTIGADVWVGSGAIILPGVTIGARTVIGAGSVVSRNLPEDALAVGNPCRVVRQIDRD
jgi:maltose O-acetyltransferase